MTSIKQSMRLLACAKQLSQKGFHTSSINKATVAEQAAKTQASLEKLQRLQAAYQKDDGLPVHLKAGLRDKVLLYVTYGLIGVGLVMSGNFLQKAIWPPKPE